MIGELGVPVILDCKRGDIGSTAEHYAKAAYDTLNADAVTLSPYMGWDSIKPFVTGAYSCKGAFILCKTSNPSSKVSRRLFAHLYVSVVLMSVPSQEFQDAQFPSGETLFERAIESDELWLPVHL